MKNRFLITAFVFFCGIFFVKAQADKPNIIWLVCEDQSPQFFPMYGDKTVSLPHLEQLAKESVLFDNMHATTPVCSPARSAIITGMYPTTLGTHNMRTYNEGRNTNQPHLRIPSYSPKFPDYIRPFTAFMRGAGYYCTNSNKQDYNFKISSDAWDQSCRYCQGKEKDNIHWRNRAEGQPFFAVFNFQITHESKVWEQQKNERHVTEDEIENIPPYYPNDPVVKQDLAVNYSNLVRMDREVGTIIQELKKQGLYDDAYIFFYSDHGGPFPRHKRAIYQTGTKVPLLVKYPKAKLAGKKDDRLLSFVDLAPTVLRIAGLQPPSYMQGKSFFDDKSTTWRDFLVTASDRFDGQYDRIRAIQNYRYKLIRNFYPNTSHHLDIKYRKNMPMMQRLHSLYLEGKLNDQQQKWFQTKPYFEFYDLKLDPFELNNLIDDPSHQERIKLFKSELEAWMIETNDLGAVPENEIIKKSKTL